MTSLSDMFEARAIDFHHAAMMAALGAVYLAWAAHQYLGITMSPTDVLKKREPLKDATRDECVRVKSNWYDWLTEMENERGLSIEPAYFTSVAAAQAEAARLDDELLRAWARLRVISKRCGPALMTSPLIGRRVLVAVEHARLYALRNLFMD